MARSHGPTITSGRFRGRRLVVPAGRITRPTRSLVRQALFDMLGPAIVGAQVLDLYSGSGALGLEALSRGARRVVFVEKHPRALAALRQNLAACGVRDDERTLLSADVARWEPGGETPFQIVLADPPFALSDALPRALERPGVLSDDALLAYHAPAERAAIAPGGCWQAFRQRRHGRSAIHLFVRTG